MSDKYFLDTNIFLYSFDKDAPQKQITAKNIIETGLIEQDAVISTQVIQEFLNVATRKFANPLSKEDCQSYLQLVLSPLCKIFPTIALYKNTLQLMQSYNYSLYDSLIIAAALSAGCTVLYSEDLQHGQQIETMKIIKTKTKGTKTKGIRIGIG